jgi:hypothetical protein
MATTAGPSRTNAMTAAGTRSSVNVSGPVDTMASFGATIRRPVASAAGASSRWR